MHSNAETRSSSRHGGGRGYTRWASCQVSARDSERGGVPSRLVTKRIIMADTCSVPSSGRECRGIIVVSPQSYTYSILYTFLPQVCWCAVRRYISRRSLPSSQLPAIVAYSFVRRAIIHRRIYYRYYYYSGALPNERRRRQE